MPPFYFRGLYAKIKAPSLTLLKRFNESAFSLNKGIKVLKKICMTSHEARLL